MSGEERDSDSSDNHRGRGTDQEGGETPRGAGSSDGHRQAKRSDADSSKAFTTTGKPAEKEGSRPKAKESFQQNIERAAAVVAQEDEGSESTSAEDELSAEIQRGLEESDEVGDDRSYQEIASDFDSEGGGPDDDEGLTGFVGVATLRDNGSDTHLPLPEPLVEASSEEDEDRPVPGTSTGVPLTKLGEGDEIYFGDLATSDLPELDGDVAVTVDDGSDRIVWLSTQKEFYQNAKQAGLDIRKYPKTNAVRWRPSRGTHELQIVPSARASKEDPSPFPNNSNSDLLEELSDVDPLGVDLVPYSPSSTESPSGRAGTRAVIICCFTYSTTAPKTNNTQVGDSEAVLLLTWPVLNGLPPETLLELFPKEKQYRWFVEDIHDQFLDWNWIHATEATDFVCRYDLVGIISEAYE